MPNLYLHKDPFMHNLCLHAPFIANWQLHVPRCFATPAGMCVPRPSPQTLAGINPDVALESYTMNITTLEVHCLYCPAVPLSSDNIVCLLHVWQLLHGWDGHRGTASWRAGGLTVTG